MPDVIVNVLALIGAITILVGSVTLIFLATFFMYEKIESRRLEKELDAIRNQYKMQVSEEVH